MEEENTLIFLPGGDKERQRINDSLVLTDLNPPAEFKTSSGQIRRSPRTSATSNLQHMCP